MLAKHPAQRKRPPLSSIDSPSPPFLPAKRARTRGSLARTLLLGAAVASTTVTNAQSQPQPTPCFRWSGQMAVANAPGSSSGNGTSSANTLWYYGGQAKLESSQTSNWWTNALVSLALDQGTSSDPAAPSRPWTDWQPLSRRLGYGHAAAQAH